MTKICALEISVFKSNLSSSVPKMLWKYARRSYIYRYQVITFRFLILLSASFSILNHVR